MPNFIDIFRHKGQISFTGMRNVAMSLLPTEKMKLDKLYNDLKRGTGILDDDDHLNMYLRSFGKMHKAKLDAAFKCIHNPSDLFGSPVEIYDWGCGQGTATVCLLDFLKANRIAADILSINLIEPSAAAVWDLSPVSQDPAGRLADFCPSEPLLYGGSQRPAAQRGRRSAVSEK